LPAAAVPRSGVGEESAVADALMARPRRRKLVAVLAGTGGACVVAGAALPWLTVFRGLDSYSGTAGSNGQLLASGGAAVILLGFWYGIRGTPRTRYAIGILGFALALFSAYLVAQLLVTYRSLEGIFLPALGPGVFVSAAGALLIVATLLIETEAHPQKRQANRVDATAAALIALSTGAGTIHLAVASEHFDEAVLFGAFFVAAGVAQTAWAAVVAIHGPSRRLLLAALANSAVIALWIVSRTSGLPVGPHPHAPEAVGFPDLTATLFELAVIGFVGWSMRHRHYPTTRRLARLAWALPLAVSSVTIAAVLAAVGAAVPS
jgi:hypothetical protein